MFRSVLDLFSRSPFGPMQEHMRMAQKCVDLLSPMMHRVVAGNWAEVKALSKEIYHFEQEADTIKNSIRNSLPKSLFMPVDRRDLLDILHSIDSIADTVEDVAASLQLKTLHLPEHLAEPLLALTDRAIETAQQAGKILDELDAIVEASFGGPEAEKVLRMIEEAGRLEHVTDIAQQRFVRLVLALEDSMKPLDIFMWLKVSQEIGNLANNAERVADKLRLLISK
jgi:predicted phosphate transport protein (TIGR00153 family)